MWSYCAKRVGVADARLGLQSRFALGSRLGGKSTYAHAILSILR